MEVSARGRLLCWGSWFAVVNAALLGIVGLRYLWYYSALTPLVAWVYAVLAYVGQLTALGLGVFGFNLFGDSLRDALDPQVTPKELRRGIRYRWLSLATPEKRSHHK